MFYPFSKAAAAVVLVATVIPSLAKAVVPTMHWYRGNTHTHTNKSDGDSPPDVVARWYREHGYQFLFITDHEAVTDAAPINALLAREEKFLVLPGQEVTQWSKDPKRSAAFVLTWGAPAHVNALFSKEAIWPVGARECQDPGCGASAPAEMPVAETFRANIAAIREQGAIAQVNHPNLLWALKPEDLRDIPDGTLLEIWNGAAGAAVTSPAPPNNLGGDDGNGDVRPSAAGFWDWLLSRGKIVWGVGADDSHVFDNPESGAAHHAGQAWIMVRASGLTPSQLKAAIAKGEFYASTGVAFETIEADGSHLSMTVAPPRSTTFPDFIPRYMTQFVGKDGQILASAAGLKPTYRFKGSETYVRAVITDSTGRQAWTQPVFTDARKAKSPYRADASRR